MGSPLYPYPHDARADQLGTDAMIIDFDTPSHTSSSNRPQGGGAQFAMLMAQACPLFAPWPTPDQSLRATTIASSAMLAPHPTSSNRREGRHARE